MDLAKVKIVVEWQAPCSLRDVQYFRKFLPEDFTRLLKAYFASYTAYQKGVVVCFV